MSGIPNLTPEGKRLADALVKAGIAYWSDDDEPGMPSDLRLYGQADDAELNAAAALLLTAPEGEGAGLREAVDTIDKAMWAEGWTTAHPAYVALKRLEAAALTKLPAAQEPAAAGVVGWQPIETAPKDETAILLACADWPPSFVLGKPVPVKVGGWHLNERYWQVFGASWHPTHWRPLPAFPDPTPPPPVPKTPDAATGDGLRPVFTWPALKIAIAEYNRSLANQGARDGLALERAIHAVAEAHGFQGSQRWRETLGFISEFCERLSPDAATGGSVGDGGLRIVFDGPPGPQAGRFVEVEDAHGRSVSVGHWRQRPDGLWELRLPDPACDAILRSALQRALWTLEGIAHDVESCAWLDDQGPDGTLETIRAALALTPADPKAPDARAAKHNGFTAAEWQEKCHQIAKQYDDADKKAAAEIGTLEAKIASLSLATPTGSVGDGGLRERYAQVIHDHTCATMGLVKWVEIVKCPHYRDGYAAKRAYSLADALLAQPAPVGEDETGVRVEDETRRANYAESRRQHWQHEAERLAWMGRHLGGDPEAAPQPPKAETPAGVGEVVGGERWRESLRKGFEAWIKGFGFPTRRRSGGSYENSHTVMCWNAWKAAHTNAALSTAPAARPGDEVERAETQEGTR